MFINALQESAAQPIAMAAGGQAWCDQLGRLGPGCPDHKPAQGMDEGVYPGPRSGASITGPRLLSSLVSSAGRAQPPHTKHCSPDELSQDDDPALRATATGLDDQRVDAGRH